MGKSFDVMLDEGAVTPIGLSAGWRRSLPGHARAHAANCLFPFQQEL